MMKCRNYPIIFLAILIFITTLLGCSSDSKSVAEVMKMIPADVKNVNTLDLDEIRRDDDLDKFYNDLDDSFPSDEFFGIKAEDIDIVAEIYDEYSEYNETTLLKGTFDISDIRDELENNGLIKDEYIDIEVWGSEDIYVALIDNNIVIIGDEDRVKDCIGVIKDGSSSLYDDNDFKDVRKRLPEGLMMTWDENRYYDVFIPWDQYDELAANSISLSKKDGDTMAFTAIFKFNDENAAKSAVDGIEKDIEYNDNWRNIRVTQTKEFIKATAEIDIEDLFSDPT